MKIKDLSLYRCNAKLKGFVYRTELFNKAIWGDMGEDSAQISVHIDHHVWQYSFIRTQSGDPSPFDDFQSNVIDEYEKELNDEQFYGILAMHALLADFEHQCNAFLHLQH